MMERIKWLSMLALLALAPGQPGVAQGLVADLSDHLIAISTGFTGTSVTLFGTAERDGDVVMVVQGPVRPTTLRRQERVAGVWANTSSITFAQVPRYYSVASSRPLSTIASEAVLRRHNLGLDNLSFPVLGDTPEITSASGVSQPPEQTIDAFRAGLIRNKQREGLYVAEDGRITTLGDRLFRSTVYFPAHVPTGRYTVSVFLFREGDLIGAQTTPLIVSKIGLGAAIFDFAQRYGAAYGFLAVTIAIFAGWLSGALFRSPR